MKKVNLHIKALSTWFVLILLALNLTANNAQAAPVYAALGASDAIGYGAEPSTNGYVFRIADWLNTNHGAWTLSNHGVSGYTAPEIRDTALSATISERPTLVTLWVGGNDVKNSVLRGDPVSVLETRFRDAYTTIIQRLRNETPAFIVSANLPDLSRIPIAVFLTEEQKQEAHTRSVALNRIIAEVNTAYNVPLVDLFNDARSYDPNNYSDGFHPNNTGYALIAQKFESVIGPVLARHNISGRVVDTAGVAIAGAKVRITHNGRTTDLVTDSRGNFILGGVGFDRNSMGTYVLTPSQSDYTFTPLSRSITLSSTVTGATGLIFTGKRIPLVISGTVFDDTVASTPNKPMPNVPLFLFSRLQLPSLAATLVNPAVLPTGVNAIARTRTNTAGQYTFTVQPGSYYVIPIVQGAVFSAVFRGPITITTKSLPNQTFTKTGLDTTAPTASISNASPTSVSGSASDTVSGILAVVVTLQNTANQYLNWSSSSGSLQFTPTPNASSYKFASAPGNTAPLLNLNKITAQNWAITLPSNLPADTYRVTVRAIDRALRLSAIATGSISKVNRGQVVATSPVVLSSAIASTSRDYVALRFSGALEPETASDPLHYSITVNGQRVPPESASYDAHTRAVILGLPTGSLRTGDHIVVQWRGLSDQQGRAAAGHIALRATN